MAEGWAALGECIVGLVGGDAARHLRYVIPEGTAPMPGPAAVIAASWSASPVGAFREFVVVRPARIGAHLAWAVVESVVNEGGAACGRSAWGSQPSIGDLAWWVDGDRRQLEWVNRAITVTGTVGRIAMPVFLPLRTVMGGEVVPGRLRGWGRLARVDIDVEDPADPLGSAAGRHHGLVIGGAHLDLAPLRPPLPSPRATVLVPRAVSSVG